MSCLLLPIVRFCIAQKLNDSVQWAFRVLILKTESAAMESDRKRAVRVNQNSEIAA